MKLGNRNDAARALRAMFAWTNRYENEFDECSAWESVDGGWGFTLPTGIHFMGSGAFRYVFTVDEVVAYKVCPDSYDDRQNMEEWVKFKRYADKFPKGYRLPNMQMYTVNGRHILAVEIVKAPRREINIPQADLAQMPFRWRDRGSNNYRIESDGTVVLIDFA